MGLRFRCWLFRGLLTALGLGFLPLQAQTTSPPPLTLDEVFAWVLDNHPVARQADLLPEMAQQELRVAKGAFDPSLDIHWNQKRLFNKDNDWQPATYYRNWNNFVKVPAWFMDVKAGYEQYLGINVNPENFTPKQGLIYIEAMVPLGADLLMDQRRATLKQARYLQQLNAAEQVKVINKLLLQVAKDYWAWYEQYQLLQVQQEGLDLAETRYQWTLESILAGDLAPVDSVEARLQVFKMQIAQREAEVAYRNQSLRLSNHLWNEAGDPLELGPEVNPADYTFGTRPLNDVTLDTLRDRAGSSHPELRKLRFKLLQYRVEERYRKSQLLPKADFRLKPMMIPQSEKYDFVGPYDMNYWRENFFVSINFYMPLFLRKERGKLAKTRLKIREQQLALDQRAREIRTEVEAAYNEVKNFESLISTQQEAVDFARRLLEAEQIKFENGESSLFKVNSRAKTLLAQNGKLVKLQVKYAKAQATLRWSAGLAPTGEIQ